MRRCCPSSQWYSTFPLDHCLFGSRTQMLPRQPHQHIHQVDHRPRRRFQHLRVLQLNQTRALELHGPQNLLLLEWGTFEEVLSLMSRLECHHLTNYRLQELHGPVKVASSETYHIESPFHMQMHPKDKCSLTMPR